MSGPEPTSVHSSVPPAAQTPPPGQFLTPELESDCARFIQEVKELALRRAAAVAAESGRL